MVSNKEKITNIVIFGAGGLGREILWTLLDCNKKSKKYNVLGFIDDNKSLKGKTINKIRVLGGLEWFSTKSAKNVSCIVGIGDSKLRKKIVDRLKKKDIQFPSIIHPSVVFSESIQIGKGTVIQAGSILTVNAKFLAI